MLVREYSSGDLDKLKRIHAKQGFDYVFPEIDDPIFVSKMVLEDERGRLAMASLARLTCEMYLLMDPDVGSPKDRYAGLVEFHQTVETDLVAKGLDDAHAWLPPRVAKRFGERLQTLGWVKDNAWTPYCRHLHV